VAEAEHFLSRLDRLDTSEVDIALQLYRDPDLLRAIMQTARISDSIARVAISLADPVEGPFIVVTRDGHFVTCLGTGMHASQWPVITRGQLDAISQKILTLRERMALAMRLAGKAERPCARLMHRLVVASDSVSREDFVAVSAWEPMLSSQCLDLYLAMCREILVQGAALRTLRKIDGRLEKTLHDYWNLVHAAGHFVLLGTMGGDREHFQQITQAHPEVRSAFSWSLTSTCLTPFITRGAWGVGRLGKQLLPAYKKALTEDISLYDWLDTVFGLVAIGRRTSGLRAEIVKALRASPLSSHNKHAARLRHALGRELRLISEFASHVIELDSNELEQALLGYGRSICDLKDSELSKEMLDDVMRVAPLHNYQEGMSDGGKLTVSLHLVAATARDAPERFYFPRDVVHRSRVAWKPEYSLRLLEPMRQAERRDRVPARRAEVPGPNQPCSCGSGKKYKKCCKEKAATTTSVQVPACLKVDDG